jgi:biotin carboxyl carrier protein
MRAIQQVEVDGDPASARDVDPDAPDAPEVADLGGGRVRLGTPATGSRARLAVVEALRPHPDGRARFEVVVDGWRFQLAVEDAARARLRRRATRAGDAVAASSSAEIRAIIPGRVAAVRVAAGDEVPAGETLLVVEAMKMQNELRAPRPGTVERVAVGEGQTIERGDLLLVLR